MMKFVREWGEAIVVALVLTIIIRFFVVQAFKIPSSSMEDTLLVGDYLLVNKFIYGVPVPFSNDHVLPMRDPERGDVIVFEFPAFETLAAFQQRNIGVGEEIQRFWLNQVKSHRKGKVDFIKRIVAVPGDKVTVEGKKLHVNGKAVEMPQAVFKDGQTYPTPRDFIGPVTVPENRYFVMGDNRDYSLDSRFWGFVPRDSIKGLAFIKYWSWDAQKFQPRWSRLGRLIE